MREIINTVLKNTHTHKISIGLPFIILRQYDLSTAAVYRNVTSHHNEYLRVAASDKPFLQPHSSPPLPYIACMIPTLWPGHVTRPWVSSERGTQSPPLAWASRLGDDEENVSRTVAERMFFLVMLQGQRQTIANVANFPSGYAYFCVIIRDSLVTENFSEIYVKISRLKKSYAKIFIAYRFISSIPNLLYVLFIGSFDEFFGQFRDISIVKI